MNKKCKFRSVIGEISIAGGQWAKFYSSGKDLEELKADLLYDYEQSGIKVEIRNLRFDDE